MTLALAAALLGSQNPFDHPVTIVVCVIVLTALIVSPLAVLVLSKLGKISEKTRRELLLRCATWAVLAPLMIGPVLLGAKWTIFAVGVLSLLCYREFARATGLFRERAISAAVVVGIVLITFAARDHWYGLFVAIPPLMMCFIAAVAIARDDPRGYIQRVALGIMALLFFGFGLGHLGYMANSSLFRPMIIWLIFCVEMNDVFAYMSGRLFGKRKLAPNTSPNKTVAGALGALVLTTLLAAMLGHHVFINTAMDHPLLLIAVGLIISIAGQFGDLMLSSVKRDLGVKDLGVLLPGHGGLLDRFDSLLLAAPAVFHFVGYVIGIGLDQPQRIITGG